MARAAANAVGNVLTIKDYKAGGTQTQTFTYDALDRLKTARASGGNGGAYSQRNYAYNAIGNITNFEGTAYYYQDSAHKHAVTHLGGTSSSYQKCWYDANGNQFKRKVGSATYNQVFDAENHLTQVSGAASAIFVYDGDGNRVKATFGSAKTAYVGNHFEWTGSTSTMKKYYYANGQRVAMRQGSSTIYWLLGDHLGSTALTAYYSGGKKAELRYYPYGKTRYTHGSTPTSLRFTGQREDATIGLYFYNARYYDPYLNRFISADSIVPEPGNPQDFNRYSYVRNSPLNYTDPSGHAMISNGGGGYIPRHPPILPPPRATAPIDPGKWVGIGDDINDAREAASSLATGATMVRGGLGFCEGESYAGQVIVRGSRAAKDAARINRYLTHARATHPELVGYTNEWVAAGRAAKGQFVSLAIVYGIDAYEYGWGTKSDVGLNNSEFASALTADTAIQLGPPAVGAMIGTALAGPPGTAIGTGVGIAFSIVWGAAGREGTIAWTDENIWEPFWSSSGEAQRNLQRDLFISDFY